MPRFFLACDGSGHEYIVPDERREEWGAWANLPEDDERSWEVPEWAIRVNRSGWTFTDPRGY